jgi:hypothetical protein
MIGLSAPHLGAPASLLRPNCVNGETAMKWISYGETESGDDLKPIVWDEKPTDKQVEDAYRELYPIEFKEVGFVHAKVRQAE